MYQHIRPYLKVLYRAGRYVALGLEQVTVRFMAACLLLLPTRLWLGVRERAQVVRRTDYKETVYMYVDSRIELETRIHEAKKEPDTVLWIEKWFKPGDVFYDVGANVGSYSLIATRHLRGDIRVVAFEPSFMNFPKLCRNVALNGMQEQITPFQVALYDKTALVPFHYYSLDSGSALHSLNVPQNSWGSNFEPKLTLPTLSFRLDDLVGQLSLPHPHHLKIDVDGVEYQILRGARAILEAPEMRSVLIEASEDYIHTTESMKLLEECGLILRSRSGYFDENCIFTRGD